MIDRGLGGLPWIPGNLSGPIPKSANFVVSQRFTVQLPFLAVCGLGRSVVRSSVGSGSATAVVAKVNASIRFTQTNICGLIPVLRGAMLYENPCGNYRFLTGIAPYSSGVVAVAGYEIVHVTLARPIPFRQGFEQIDRHLSDVDRSRHALCAVELRLPAPLSFDGFSDFNRAYQQLLASWGLLLDGRNPVARTNIAPAVMPPSEPSLYAFAYTRSTHRPGVVDNAGSAGDTLLPTFVVAGAGDLRDQSSLSASAIIRPEETSAAALREKAAAVMQVMQTRLEGLGVDWSADMTVDIYTVHAIHSFLKEIVLDHIGEAANRGVCWHYAHPPIAGLAYEMDLRCTRSEYTLSVDTSDNHSFV